MCDDKGDKMRIRENIIVKDIEGVYFTPQRFLKEYAINLLAITIPFLPQEGTFKGLILSMSEITVLEGILHKKDRDNLAMVENQIILIVESLIKSPQFEPLTALLGDVSDVSYQQRNESHFRIEFEYTPILEF